MTLQQMMMVMGDAGGGGLPNEDGNLKLSDGTFISTRAAQNGFSVNIQIFFDLDGGFRVVPNRPGTPVWQPADEWYLPGTTSNIGNSYEVRCSSVDGDLFAVEAAPVGTWIGINGGTFNYRRWMIIHSNVVGQVQTTATFEMRGQGWEAGCVLDLTAVMT